MSRWQKFPPSSTRRPHSLRQSEPKPGGASTKLLRKRTAKSRPISRPSNARNYKQSRSVIGAGFIACTDRVNRHRPEHLLRRSNVVAAGRWTATSCVCKHDRFKRSCSIATLALMIAPLQHFSPDRQPDDEKDQAHHQEKEKEEFSDSRGGRSN